MVLFQEPFPHIIMVPISLGDIVTIQQGVPGDAVPWPGRGVSPQNPLFPGPPQAARERYLNSYTIS